VSDQTIPERLSPRCKGDESARGGCYDRQRRQEPQDRNWPTRHFGTYQKELGPCVVRSDVPNVLRPATC